MEELALEEYELHLHIGLGGGEGAPPGVLKIAAQKSVSSKNKNPRP